ncbi:hypothetical protein AQ920_21760 [Burkholderia pseudomallei]|nr:hypothetical protein AQ920_21760 [Burkholderia pseudomallei]
MRVTRYQPARGGKGTAHAAPTHDARRSSAGKAPRPRAGAADAMRRLGATAPTSGEDRRFRVAVRTAGLEPPSRTPLGTELPDGLATRPYHVVSCRVASPHTAPPSPATIAA